MAGMKQDARRKADLGVGAIVRFMFGGHEVQATVVEDRGPIGAKGRRLLRVRLVLGATDPIELEVPADEVRIAAGLRADAEKNAETDRRFARARKRFLASDSHRKLLIDLAKR